MVKSLLSPVIDYIFPYRCSACSELTNQKDGVCSDCFQKLNFITDPYCNICGTPFDFVMDERMICAQCVASPPEYTMSRSLFKFDEQSKKLVHSFKYNDQTIYAKMFARLLVARYRKDIGDVDLVVPVPMNRFKRIIRNYNPAQILASEVAKLIDKPMEPGLLIKQRWTKAQTGLSRAGRSKNLLGSIKMASQYGAKDKVVLLIDDVKTTGATSSLCSKILKKHGAKEVRLATISLT